jgi:hypothetical protein
MVEAGNGSTDLGNVEVGARCACLIARVFPHGFADSAVLPLCPHPLRELAPLQERLIPELHGIFRLRYSQCRLDPTVQRRQL